MKTDFSETWPVNYTPPEQKKDDVRERDIENHLCVQVGIRGGAAFKWSSPSNNGVPDRIVFLPGMERPVYVELKKPGEKPSPVQSAVHDTLRRLGQDVFVIDSKKGVEEFISLMEMVA